MSDSVDPRSIKRENDTELERVPRGEPKMSKNWGKHTRRDPLTQAMMKAKMAALYAEPGHTLEEIALAVSDEFGLDEPITGKTVSYHIQNMLREWQAKSLASIDEKNAMQLARIDQIEMQAMNSFFLSCQGIRVTNFQKEIEMARSKKREEEIRDQAKEEREKNGTKPFTNGALPQMLEVMNKKVKTFKRFTENEAGDPRWLHIMLQCVDMRNRMWGLYIKDKDMVNPDQEMARLSEDERDKRLVALLTVAAQRRAGVAANGNLAPATPLGGEIIDTEAKEVTDEESDNVDSNTGYE